MTFDTAPGTPAFPASPLDIRAELLLAGTWTDISSYVQRDPVVIGRGKPDESTTPAPSTLAMTLNNTDGRFSSKNAAGPYYGSLRRNTQARISLPEGATFLRLEDDQASYAQLVSYTTPDPPHGSVDYDIQIDASTYWNGYAAGGAYLGGAWTSVGNQRSWLLAVLDDGCLFFAWSTDGTIAGTVTATSTVPVTQPPGNGRQSVRVTLAHSTGTVIFYTSTSTLTSPSWTQLGSTLVASSTTIFGLAVGVTLGHVPGDTDYNYQGMNGKIHAFLWESGIAGTTYVNPDFTAEAAGTTSFSDGHGNLWELAGTAEISNRKYRGHFEVPAWPQSQDPTGLSVYTSVTGGGLLRRIDQKEIPENSAMYRAYVRLPAADQLADYWPLEDGSNATSFASAVGGVAGTWTGTPTLASDSTFICSAPLPVCGSNSAGASFSFPVTNPLAATWDANVIRFLMLIPASGEANNSVIARIYTTGSCSRVDLVYGTAGTGTLTMTGYDTGGIQLWTSGALSYTAGVEGVPMRVSVELATTAATLVTVLPGADGETYSVPSSTGTIGPVTKVELNPLGQLTQTVFGHLSAQGFQDSVFDLQYALNAWIGETAGARVARLCSEEGYQFRGRGSLAATAAMGAQTLETLPSLLQECADADLGTLFELRQQLGFGYRTRDATGNQAAAVTLSYDEDHLDVPTQEPTEDDQTTINDVTVEQTSDGSSARQYAAPGQPIDGGDLNINPSNGTPPGIGRYDQQYEVNLDADSQLNDNAGWRLHMGTVDEPRYPGIGCDLANTNLDSLQNEILDMDLGDRLIITDAPIWNQPGNIDQILNGYTETLQVARTLTESWQGVPYDPWNAGYVGGDELGGHQWVDTDGSALITAYSSSATTLYVATLAGYPAWTTTSSDWPFDIQAAGEIAEVTAIAAAAYEAVNSQGFESGTGGWAGTNATVSQSTAEAFTGTHSLQVLITGSPSTAQAISQQIPVIPGVAYYSGGQVYNLGGWADCQWEIGWYDADGDFIDAVTGTITSITAATWTQVQLTGGPVAPGNAVTAVYGLFISGTPTGRTFYVDVTSFGPLLSQAFTVTRSVNGVSKAQTAATPVSLAYPAIVSF